ncbi:MAG: HAD family hydrolase [Verrucomicrobiota bacterium]|nr:HAD hydrolase-like protein [Verrucomicrobiota bacterium]
MVRLVLFDIDGTLVHTGGAGIKAFARVFATEFNLTHGVERIKFAGRTDVNIVREFFFLHGISASAENFRRFFERYVFWLDHILAESQTEACPGVGQILRALRALPQPPLIGLLTGNIQLGAEIKLRHFDLWREFELGAFADDHEERDQIAHAARHRASRVLKRELRGEEIVVIGDTPLDIRCGRAIGAKVLAVATGGATLDELRPHKADWLVENLEAVTARDLCA